VRAGARFERRDRRHACRPNLDDAARRIGAAGFSLAGYTMIAIAGRATLPALCMAALAVERDAIHANTAGLVDEFFARHLR
jgi:hypothetical protein